MPEKAPTRLRDIAEKGGFDVLMMDPCNILVEDGHNPRQFDSPDMIERVEAIADSIVAHGFWEHEALLLRYDAGKAYLVDGETRLRAVMRAIEKGADIVKVPVISVKATNEKQRLLIALAANTGRQLTPLESGSAFQRLIRFGMTPQDIARQLTYSLQFVTTALELFDSPQDVQKLVAANEVTPARAVSEVKKHGSRAGETLKAAVEQKKADGGGIVTRERTSQAPPARREQLPSGERSMRQRSVQQWARDAFGPDQADSLPQRGLRHAEEALELAQAAGTPRGMLHQLIDSIYDKPKGVLRQEIGGSALTLLVLAAAAGIDADEAEIEEVERVLAKPLEHFRTRNDAKNEAGFLAI